MTQPNIPTPVELLLSVPLYSKVPFDGLESWAVVEVLFYAGTYDSYCTKCRRDATFQIVAPERPAGFVRNIAYDRLQTQHGLSPILPPLQLGIHEVHARCTRQETHNQDFLFFIDQELVQSGTAQPTLRRTIEKVGQQPSYGDLHISQIKKYTHVLSKGQLSEFSRAIGLASHDVGVGSYVYLRKMPRRSLTTLAIPNAPIYA